MTQLHTYEFPSPTSNVTSPDTGNCSVLWLRLPALGLSAAQLHHEFLASKAFDSASTTLEPHLGVLVPCGHSVNIIDLALTDAVTVAQSS